MNLGQWIGLIALGVSLYIMWQIRQVLLLLFVAVVLATALNRLVRRLQLSGLQRSFAVFLAVLMLFTFIVGFFLLIVPPFVNEFQQLNVLLPKGLNRVVLWIEQLTQRLPAQVTPYLPDVNNLIEQLQPLAKQVLDRSLVLFSTSLGVLLNFLLVLVLTLMLLANPYPYRSVFITLFPSFYRRRADSILSQCEIALGRWIIGAFIGMSAIALLSWVGLSVLGVRLALAHGILAGLLNFIPNIGPTLSVILPMAVALLDTPWKAGAVLILYIIIQQLESVLLTPLIMAQQVSLLPALTLLSQVIFTIAFGSLGLVMSLPLAVVAQIWIREVVIKDVLDGWGKQLTIDNGQLTVNDERLTIDNGQLTIDNEPEQSIDLDDRTL